VRAAPVDEKCQEEAVKEEERDGRGEMEEEEAEVEDEDEWEAQEGMRGLTRWRRYAQRRADLRRLES
jgi:hypothetical protein